MQLKDLKSTDEGYWWVVYKDFGNPQVVYLKFETWDNTRDGDRWVILDWGDWMEENEFHKYRFLCKIEPPNPLEY